MLVVLRMGTSFLPESPIQHSERAVRSGYFEQPPKAVETGEQGKSFPRSQLIGSPIIIDNQIAARLIGN